MAEREACSASAPEALRVPSVLLSRFVVDREEGEGRADGCESSACLCCGHRDAGTQAVGQAGCWMLRRAGSWRGGTEGGRNLRTKHISIETSNDPLPVHLLLCTPRTRTQVPRQRARRVNIHTGMLTGSGAGAEAL